MNESKFRNFLHLSQGEILGFDSDKFVQINLTKLKKYLCFLMVSFGYVLNGFFVGWSSKFFSLVEESRNLHYLQRSQTSWIISTYPLGVVIVSIFLMKFYYTCGTKLLLLGASFLISLSWLIIMAFGNVFETLLLARLMGGIGSGIIFILVPLYMKELRGAHNNQNIVDLLITLFGLGIFTQYLIDFVMQTSFVLAIAMIFSTLFFVICCIIPESPHYRAYCEMKEAQDWNKAIKLHNLWSAQDLERKSIVDLFAELKKLNLLSLIGLILVEQFIGGVSILFYMKYFARLTGGQFSPELIATTVGLTLILSVPFSKITRFTKIASAKRQIVISSVAILFCMIFLSVFCIVEGSNGYKLKIVGPYVPMIIFVTVTFFYVVGISRNSMLIMQKDLSSHSLQLHLRTLSIAITWFFIFAITKLLPQLLYLIGVGYFYSYMAFITLVSLIFLCKIMPSSLSLQSNSETSDIMEESFVVPSDSNSNELRSLSLSV